MQHSAFSLMERIKAGIKSDSGLRSMHNAWIWRRDASSLTLMLGMTRLNWLSLVTRAPRGRPPCPSITSSETSKTRWMLLSSSSKRRTRSRHRVNFKRSMRTVWMELYLNDRNLNRRKNVSPRLRISLRFTTSSSRKAERKTLGQRRHTRRWRRCGGTLKPSRKTLSSRI